MRGKRLNLPEEIITPSNGIWKPEELRRVNSRPKAFADVLEIVSLYRRIGVPVLPSEAGTKHPWRKIYWREFQKPSLTEDDWKRIEDYFVEFVKEFGIEKLNFVGIIHAPWNYMFIDYDIPLDERKPVIPPEKVLQHIVSLSESHGMQMLPCWVVYSGKGLHLHLKPTQLWLAVAKSETRKPEDIASRGNILKVNGVEVRAEFYYRWHIEVLPPSVHPDLGVMYRYSEMYNPATTLLGSLPEPFLRELLGSDYDADIPEISAVKTEMELGLYSPEEFTKTIVDFVGDYYIRGQRHWVVLGLVGTLRHFNIPQQVAVAVVEEAVRRFEDEEASDRLKCVETTYSIPISDVAGSTILRDADKMKEKPFTFEDVKRLYEILSNFGFRRKTISFPELGDAASDERLARLCYRLLEGRIFVVAYDDETKKVAYYNPNTGLYDIGNPTSLGVLKEDITQLVKNEINARLQKGDRLPSETRKTYDKMLKKVENRGVKEIAERLKDICEAEGVVLSPEDFNPPPDTFVLENGVVRLVSEEVGNDVYPKLVFLPHSPTIRSRKRFPVKIREENIERVMELFRRGEERKRRDGTPNVDFSEISPLFYKLLLRFSGGNLEYLDYIERVLGYLLWGHASEECFFIVWGVGGTGKSTLTNLLSQVFGEYAYHSPTRILKAVTYSSELHEEILATANERRLILLSDLPANLTLWGEAIKTLAGRDYKEPRQLFQRRFKMFRMPKILAVTNTYPNFADLDSGVVRRVKALPWLGKPIPPKEYKRDYELEILAKDGDGVFAALLFCLLKWWKYGLQDTPSVVRSFTAEILLSADLRDAWIKDRLEEVTDHQTFITFQEAYDDFVKWLKAFGYDVHLPSEYLERITDERNFASYMKRRFAKHWSRDREKGNVIYRGLRFKFATYSDDGDDFDDTPSSDGTKPLGEAETETQDDEEFPLDEAVKEASLDGDGVRNAGGETTFGEENLPDGTETQPDAVSSIVMTGGETLQNNFVETEAFLSDLKVEDGNGVGDGEETPTQTEDVSEVKAGKKKPSNSVQNHLTFGETETDADKPLVVVTTIGKDGLKSEVLNPSLLKVENPNTCPYCRLGELRKFHDTGYLQCSVCYSLFSQNREKLPLGSGWKFSDYAWDWCPECGSQLLLNEATEERLCGNCKKVFTKEETMEGFVCPGCGRNPEFDEATGYFVCRQCREVFSLKGETLNRRRDFGWNWDKTRRCPRCHSILMVRGNTWMCPNCGREYWLHPDGELEENGHIF